MFGYVRAQQICEGIHTRLWARTFVVASLDGRSRVALVTADLGSVTQELVLEVVEDVKKALGGLYTVENVVIAATHTHSGPGGYWHHGADTPLGAPFYEEHFKALARGIAESILAAHADLRPGRVLIAQGEVRDAGAQRSRDAYLRNSAPERALFDGDVDRTMVLLKFEVAGRAVGVLNWFAVHGTSFSPRKRLISGDNKGFAAGEFERRRGAPPQRPGAFVAAFAQGAAGDVTPNLNLDGTGPGGDELDSARTIGQRQLDRAMDLFAAAREELDAVIDYRHAYVDFSRGDVGSEFSGREGCQTCPSALGYAFAAGSSEDGGGHPLFREGMTEGSAVVDAVVAGYIRRGVSAELRRCHAPKAVFVPTGEMEPPGHSQVLSLGLVQLGQLILVVGPAEFTTMAGRRIRRSVADVLGDKAQHVVVAGYANGYAGYVTTPEEYAAQHYEGGHTLFGPWTLPRYQQEYVRLARALVRRETLGAVARPEDRRGKVRPSVLGTWGGATRFALGPTASASELRATYRRREVVEAEFRGVREPTGCCDGTNFLSVERWSDGAWVSVATDADWTTTCRWSLEGPPASAGTTGNGEAGEPDGVGGAHRAARATVHWRIPADAEVGTYRIVYHDLLYPAGGNGGRDVCSRSFEVAESKGDG
jgi:neutral ceramidase